MKHRSYTDEERLGYIQEYLASPLRKHTFEKEKGLSYDSIPNWMAKFGIEDKVDPVMSEKLTKTEQELQEEVHALKMKIKALEVELKQASMARDAYNCMIDLAEKTYNIPVRKNSGAK
jgi:transposase